MPEPLYASGTTLYPAHSNSYSLSLPLPCVRYVFHIRHTVISSSLQPFHRHSYPRCAGCAGFSATSIFRERKRLSIGKSLGIYLTHPAQRINIPESLLISVPLANSYPAPIRHNVASAQPLDSEETASLGTRLRSESSYTSDPGYLIRGGCSFGPGEGVETVDVTRENCLGAVDKSWQM